MTNINEVVALCNIGTLFAFVLVAAGVIVLRVKEPGRARAFRTPWVPFVPLAAIASCAWLMIELPATTWGRFFIWLGIGLVVYLLYGFGHSRLRNGTKDVEPLNR